MPAIYISRSIEIKASPEDVFKSLRDFKTWPTWSPWIIAEPDCNLAFPDDGKSYSWDGQYVGAGEMEIIGEVKNKSFQYDLRFLKPWKSQAKVNINLDPVSDGTRVTWTLDSTLPIFMFFMKKMMEAFVGMDYERGLVMLKDLLETGEVPMSLEFGDKTVGPFQIIGRKNVCAISEIGPSMEADIAKISAWLGETGAAPAGAMMSVYHKWDPVKGQVNYTIGFPFASIPADLPEGMVRLNLPETKVATARVTGPYRYVGNAWASGMTRGRAGAFKQSKKTHPFEIYENSPAEVAENELVTTVCFPKK